MANKYDEKNAILLNALSIYLNDYASSITFDMISDVKSAGVDENYAYCLLLLNMLDLDESYLNEYLLKMVQKEKQSDYLNNPYYKNIVIDPVKKGKWEITYTTYKPYEAFVRSDFVYFLDGRLLPQIGYFEEEYKYLSVYQNNRLWMSITPNEVNTMAWPISVAKGKVCTLGLGLGYFAYMVHLKEDVSEVVVLEKDQNVIDLFNEFILPKFDHPEKIKIVKGDAFKFLDGKLDNKLDADYLFADLWHDAGDGIELYKKLKKYEDKYPSTKFDYWIYDTMKYYLGENN